MKKLLTIAFVIAAALFIFSLFASYSSLAELVVHFQLQFLLFFTFAFVIFLSLRLFGRAGFAVLLVLAALSNIYPYLPSRAARAEESGTDNLRVMFFNIFVYNTNFDSLAESIRNSDTDVIVLTEVPEASFNEISQRLPEYEYRRFVKGPLIYFDIAYFARVPIEEEKVEYLSRAKIPVVSFTASGVRIMSTHARSPLISAQTRNEQLSELAAIDWSGKVVLGGDFNVTPWSPYFKNLLEAANLRDARVRRGLLASWNTALPAIARIPIDHVLVSREVQVSDLRTGEAGGSDHLPIIADVKF